jgi:type IV pilus assembly protein PilB
MPRSLGLVLVEAGHLDRAALDALQRETGGDDRALAARLLERGLVDRAALLKARAKALGVSAVEIDPYSIDPAIVEIVPEQLARRIRAIALFRVGMDLTLAMADPSDIVAIDLARDATGCEIQPVLAAEEDIQRAIALYYDIDVSIRNLAAEETGILDSGAGAEHPGSAQELTLEDMPADGAPVVRMVNLVLLKAVRGGASDIHIEPDSDGLRIRYRVDGRLREEHKLPLALHAALVSRIKVLADLDLAQKRLPQDGRLSIKAESRKIDLRISTLPTIKGEKVVMRLLDKGSAMPSIDTLGLSAANLQHWKQLIDRPNGIVLVTGPTGSGKTTTLYASLLAINTLDRNIVTVEDPVEYDFPVMNQVQVNPKGGLTFATALRSILRQDPNVVMVGEIRDGETASIAIRAALTGHLVVSTLHTNDAPSAATRLIDMGVEPYLLASALKGILAQRLVRRICPHCVKPAALDSEQVPVELGDWLRQQGIQPHCGAGCRHCHGTGFAGRVAIHELLVIDEEIERCIVRTMPTADVRAIARRRGMVDLFSDGMEKVRARLTTASEVLVATRMGAESDAAGSSGDGRGTDDHNSGARSADARATDPRAIDPRSVDPRGVGPRPNIPLTPIAEPSVHGAV